MGHEPEQTAGREFSVRAVGEIDARTQAFDQQAELLDGAQQGSPAAGEAVVGLGELLVGFAQNSGPAVGSTFGFDDRSAQVVVVQLHDRLVGVRVDAASQNAFTFQVADDRGDCRSRFPDRRLW